MKIAINQTGLVVNKTAGATILLQGPLEVWYDASSAVYLPDKSAAVG
jgi:hypothetical protein